MRTNIAWGTFDLCALNIATTIIASSHHHTRALRCWLADWLFWRCLTQRRFNDRRWTFTLNFICVLAAAPFHVWRVRARSCETHIYTPCAAHKQTHSIYSSIHVALAARNSLSPSIAYITINHLCDDSVLHTANVYVSIYVAYAMVFVYDGVCMCVVGYMEWRKH